MIAVVSPHLDDAVLGCGARLAARPGSVLITVFAAGPESWDVVTPCLQPRTILEVVPVIRSERVTVSVLTYNRAAELAVTSRRILEGCGGARCGRPPA